MKTMLAAVALVALVPAAALACDYYDPAKSASTTPAPVATAPAPAPTAVAAKPAAPARQAATQKNASSDQKLAANAVKQ